MAFCVPLSKVRTPYEDWVQRGQPDTVAIYYHGVKFVQWTIDYVFLPKQGLMRIEYDYMGSGFCATLKIKVSRKNRTIRTTQAHCSAWNVNQYETGAPVGTGSFKFLCEVLTYYNSHANDGICYTVAQKLFGSLWYMTRFPAADKHVPSRKIKLVDNWMSKMDRHETAHYAYYDLSREEAAIKIQAAFRGWRMRMLYRYNPHNALGRFVILKEAGF